MRAQLAIGMLVITAGWTLAAGQGWRGGQGAQHRHRNSSECAATRPSADDSTAVRGPCENRGSSSGIGAHRRFSSGCRGEGLGRHQRWGARQDGESRGQGNGGCMSTEEHESIRSLSWGHENIKRVIRELPDGVETTTTTSSPDLAPILRRHVRGMVARLKADRPVRQWDPVFRDLFDHAGEIEVVITDLPDGIQVKETSPNSQVVPLIRAHASKVSRFVESGPSAMRPPWASPR